jgi:hypothetical protein
MTSLKWLGVWGMVGNIFPVNKADRNYWSRKPMKEIWQEPKGKEYVNRFISHCDIPRPGGECTLFQHITIRPITCNFK